MSSLTEVSVFGETSAPGLKEKAGRAGEPSGLGSLPPKGWPATSMADLGRRPAARGVEADIGFDGKTKGGLGGGLWEATPMSGVVNSSRSIIPAIGSERWRGLWARPSRERGMSGRRVAAIIPKAALRLEW